MSDQGDESRYIGGSGVHHQYAASVGLPQSNFDSSTHQFVQNSNASTPLADQNGHQQQWMAPAAYPTNPVQHPHMNEWNAQYQQQFDTPHMNGWDAQQYQQHQQQEFERFQHLQSVQMQETAFAFQEFQQFQAMRQQHMLLQQHQLHLMPDMRSNNWTMANNNNSYNNNNKKNNNNSTSSSSFASFNTDTTTRGTKNSSRGGHRVQQRRKTQMHRQKVQHQPIDTISFSSISTNSNSEPQMNTNINRNNEQRNQRREYADNNSTGSYSTNRSTANSNISYNSNRSNMSNRSNNTGHTDGRTPKYGVKWYTNAMNECAHKADVHGARDLIAKMNANGTKPNVITFNVLIKCYGNAKLAKDAEAVLTEMVVDYGVQPDGASYNTVIAAYAKYKQMSEAYRLVHVMQGLGLSTARAYTQIMRHVEADQVLDLLDRIGESNNNAHDIVLLNTALTVLCTAQPPLIDTARILIDRAIASATLGDHSNGQFAHPDCRSFSNLASAYGKIEDVRSALAVLEECKKLHIGLDVIVFMSVINALVSIRPSLMDEAVALVDSMEPEYHIKPDLPIYNVLIKGYARSKPPKPRAARQVFERIKREGLRPSVYTFSSLADVLCSSGQVEEAEALVLQEMKVYGVEPNATTYNILVKGHARCRCKVTTGTCACITCFCSNPERAVSLLQEMESKQLTPNRWTINAVVDSYCNSDEYTKAKSIVDDVMRKNGPKCSPTTHTYNILIHGWSRVCLRDLVSGCGMPSTADATAKLAQGEVELVDDEEVTVQDSPCCKPKAKEGSFGPEGTMTRKECIDETEVLLGEMESQNLVPDQLTCNTIVHFYAMLGDRALAEKTFTSMVDAHPHIRRHVVSYNALLKADIAMLKQRMREEHHNNNTRDNTQGNTEIDPKTAFFASVSHTLQEMDDFGVAPDLATFNSIIKVYTESSMSTEAEAAAQMLVDQAESSTETAEDAQTPKASRGSCCHVEEDEEDAKGTQEAAATVQSIKPDAVTLGSIARGYVAEGKADEADAMLRKFTLKHGIAIHASALDVVCRALTSAGLEEKARDLGAELTVHSMRE